MGELVVRRWTKYGHDRLYVTSVDGTKVGWRDQKTGESHVDVESLTADFDRAIAAYLAEPDEPAPPPPAEESLIETVTVEPAAPEPPEEDERDLLRNRPGQMAREKAEQELAEQRDRSRVWSALARLTNAHTDERAWRVGADGEESVGARLEKLTKSGWTVIHSVPVGERGSDIDHVLIGPGGVYTINTKNHRGKNIWVGKYAIKVNGQSVPYLRNSRFEGERAKRKLEAAVGFELPVRAVLVLLTGTLIPSVTIKQAPDDVLILDRMGIPGAFKRTQQRLTVEQVAVVVEAARRPGTWR